MFIQRNYMLCEALNRINLNIISLGYALIEEELRKEVIGCPFSRVYLMLRGSFRVETREGEVYELEEGGAYLIPAGAKFEYVCDKEAEYLYIHIKWSNFDQLDLLRRCKQPVCQLKKVDWQQAALHMIQKENQNLTDGIWLHNEINQLILDCVEKYDIDLSEPEYSDCTRRAIAYIQKNLSASLTVEDVARQALVARSTITRFFRNEVRFSVTEYIYDLLWTEACRMLSNGRMNMLQISEALGFCEHSFFSRQFKNGLNMRPGEFRKQALI